MTPPSDAVMWWFIAGFALLVVSVIVGLIVVARRADRERQG